MITFVGDYTCKLDTKGRVMLPSAFLKQVVGDMPSKLIAKKDVFESCLVLYPEEEWQRQVKMLRKKLNPYNREHNTFMRVFFKGVAELSVDANNRVLLPKRLLDEIGADKEIVLAGQPGKIEVWAKSKYESIGLGDDEFANMAEKLLDGLIDEAEE
jgi:MraZ protein